MRNNMHIPVMSKEVIELLNIREGGVYIDCTFGEGGHSLEILKKGGIVLAIDRDPETTVFASKIKNLYNDTFFYINDTFSNLNDIWTLNIAPMKVDGILFDLGFSSNQIENFDRGFSFMNNSSLDMRYNYNENILTGLQVINSLSENELTRIFFEYAQEKSSRKIAKAICEYRKKKKIEDCYELLKICKNFCSNSNKHFATKIFQAIRIYVNAEFFHIEKGIKESLRIIRYYGCIVVISFHSLEDLLIKKIFNNKNFKKCGHEEAALNKRARSATVRWYINREDEYA